MAITDVFNLSGELRLARGEVVGFEPGGRFRVRLGAPGSLEISCDVLRADAEPLVRFAAGVEVLVARPGSPVAAGVILGPIGRVEESQPIPAGPPVFAPLQIPFRLHDNEIVIEANNGVTLRCGEASIKITRDGKITLRGQHILSRAKGTQRIKGGSVAIN